MIAIPIIFVIIIIIYNLTTSSDNGKKEFNSKASLSTSYLIEAKKLLAQEKFHEAFSKFQQSIKECPSNLGNSDTYNYLGPCYLGMGEYKKALNHLSWRNSKEELYCKSMAALQLNDKKMAAGFILGGLNIDFDKFEAIRNTHYNIEHDINDFSLFINTHTKAQLLRNVEPDELTTNNPEIINLLKKTKLPIQSPNSLNKEGKFYRSQFSSYDTEVLFKYVDLRKLLNKDYLYLNEINISGRGIKTVAHTDIYITDLSFLKYFSKLKAITLCGQNKLVNWKFLNKMPALEELNMNRTNISASDITNKKIHIITTDDSGLKMFSESAFINSLRNRL